MPHGSILSDIVVSVNGASGAFSRQWSQPTEGTLMTDYLNSTLEFAHAIHEERIANADRWRRTAATRRTRSESAVVRTQQQPAPNVWRPRWFRDRRRVDLAAWLVRVGDIVVQYPAVELDSNRRLGLAAVVDGLLKAAREGGVDVSLCVETDDAAVALHRMLGRLAAQTAGDSIPVARHRARMLQTALDEFVQGSAEPDADHPADRAA
jgi:hypothetical protein